MMAFHGKAGDRVRMVFMPDDPDPIPAGTEGTVRDVQQMDWGHDKFSQVSVVWDNGRSLSCVCPPDHLEIISAAVNTESSRCQ
jgi:hypothetical protein